MRESFLFLASLLLAAAQYGHVTQGQTCSARLTSAVKHFRRPFRPTCNMGGTFFEPLCELDKAKMAGRHRMKFNVLLQYENCEPVAPLNLVLVIQANSVGNDTADCCKTYQTNRDGRFSFTTTRPGHYFDVSYPKKKRPRTFQFVVIYDKHYNCSDELMTQYYFKKDKRRLMDPCPHELCRSNDKSLFLKTKHITVNGVKYREVNLTITVKKTCESFAYITPRETPITPPLSRLDMTKEDCPNPEVTPMDVAGPYYIPPPAGTNKEVCWAYPGYRQLPKMKVTIKLQDKYCRPVNGVVVDLWQVHPGARYTDDCRTRLITNTSGILEYTTLEPVQYTDRPPHIHLYVHPDAPQNCYDPYVTQLYFANWFDNHKLVMNCQRETTVNGSLVTKSCRFLITLRDPGRCFNESKPRKSRPEE